MLDDYKDSQPIVYKILMNAVLKNRFSHAYLFETNGYSNKEDLALAFAKYLLCPSHHHVKGDDDNCNYCKRIADGNFPEIKIINPDGLWIKKDQLANLQKEFNRKAIESEQKVYIINNAECLNDSAANSILKFLEEPEDNVIAILMADNSYQMLETIRSRCQIIPFYQNKRNPNIININNMLFLLKESITNNGQIDKYLSDEKGIETIDKVVNFVNSYEKSGKDIILALPKIWNNYFIEKEILSLAFDIMVLYYKDVLNVLLNKPIEIFLDYDQKIIELSQSNTIDTVCNKLKIILETKENIKTNTNSSLLMDKLIIRLEGGINHD